jgi:hypothetical protein
MLFFHRIVKGRHAKTSITHLYDEVGNRVEDIDGIKEVALGFYETVGLFFYGFF